MSFLRAARQYLFVRSLLAAALCAIAGCDGAPLDGRGAGPRLGIAFVPIQTRTAEPEAQTVAHMELTGLLFLPSGGGLLVWEKSGRIVHYQLDGDTLIRRGEFKLPDVATNTDCGLISVALDPDWELNHFVYAGHCISRTASAVTRFEFHGDDYPRVPKSGVRVIEFGDPDATRSWHNVGAIGFFPDPERSMWILSGDKRNADNAQDPSTNLGGVLRIIPRRGAEGGYDPHPDNPFGGPGSDPERESSPDLYAWGLRSPWRGAIDDAGRIWVGEVGNLTEEINLVSGPGQNFGWGKVDGPCTLGARCKNLSDPIAWWGRGANHRYRLDDDSASATTRRVAWVGTPYVSNANDPYRGFLDRATLFADMCVGFVRALSVDSRGKVTRDEPVGHLTGLSGAAQAPDGHLWVTSFGLCTSDSYGIGGGIYRVELRNVREPEIEEPPASGAPLVDEPLGPVPLKLSDTGIFAGAKHDKPIARAISYQPSLPLWSNGSDKERWLLLPEGAQVDNRDRDHWEFPPGTLFVKTFSFEESGVERPIETRIIRRTRSGWDYHAYRWRGSDADLMSLERSVPVTIQPEKGGTKFNHQIPSRFECRSCHESNPTVVIGFDELRLNAPAAKGGRSQLEVLAERGVFAQPPPSDPARIDHEDAATREVLGYLHGNCAHCHNGSNNAMSPLDLGYAGALSNLIGVETQGSGQAAGVRVVPGSPEQSVLYQAMTGTGDDPELQPMPPIGVQVRDTAAIARIKAWIAKLPP